MPAFISLILLLICPKEASKPIIPAATPVVKAVGGMAAVLFNHNTYEGLKIMVYDKLRGGVFIHRPATAKLVADSAIIFRARDGGFWERELADTLKLAWYHIGTKNADNAAS